MNHETKYQAEAEVCQNAGGASVLASRLQSSAFDVSPVPAFDETKASQARSDLIAFTKIFFGLDNQCPSPSANLSA